MKTTKKRKQQEKSFINKIFVVTLLVLLSIYALTIIAALLWGLITSFKSPYDIQMNNNILGFPTLDPNNFDNSREEFFGLKNYLILARDYHIVEEKRKVSYIVDGQVIVHYAKGGFLGVIFNTLIYAGLGGFLHTIVPALTAYAVSKYDCKVSSIITGFVLFTMVTPIVGNQTSMLAMLRNLRLYDTIWGYILQKASFTGMYFLVFSAFFKSLPDSFSEAAEIDGASYWHILFHIILPLAAKTISTVFVIQFISSWNDYQTAYLYMPTHPTLAYVIWFMSTNNQIGGGEMTVRIAASMMLAMPILVAFIFLKKQLMGNVTVGGLKQ